MPEAPIERFCTVLMSSDKSTPPNEVCACFSWHAIAGASPSHSRVQDEIREELEAKEVCVAIQHGATRDYAREYMHAGGEED